jgi:H+/Cl- antiporter ClcA
MKQYALFIILGVIFSFLGWIYLSIYCYSKRYMKRLKRLKKLKLLARKIRRKHARF